MPRPRRFFPPEYKAEVVELIGTTGKTVGQVARELDLTETAVRAWVRQADLDAGRRSDGSPPPSATSCESCVVRSGICVKNARSCARPRFSSPGRPIADELLPADRCGESPPPGLPARPRARCGARGLLRLGLPPTIRPVAVGCAARRTDPPDPRAQPWHLRRPTHPRRVAPGPGRPCQPQTRRPHHVRARPARRPPSAAWWADPARSRSALGRRHYPAAHRPRLVVPRRDPGRVLASGRWLVDGRPPAHRTGPGRPGDGHQPATTATRPGLPLRPRLPIHLVRLRPPPARLRPRRFHGNGRGCAGQRRRRELLRHAGMRAARPLPLADQSRAAHGDLRFHRGLLQPPTPPLDTRLRQPRQLRAAARTSSTRRLTTVSTKAGQLQDGL